MSLESQVIDLSNQVLGLMGEVRNTLPQARAEQQAFISNWGVSGYSVLEVGAGKQFSRIEDAFYSLDGKVLKSDVLIKVADGIYPTSGLLLQNNPYAYRIRIEGNVANPLNCVIQNIPSAGVSQGVILRNLKQMGFSGFRIAGESSAANFTYRGLRIDKHSLIYCNDASIVIDGCANGVEVSDMSYLWATKLKCSNIGGYGLIADQSSSAVASDIIITGKGVATNITSPSGVQIKSQGCASTDCSRIWLGAAATIDSVYKGVYSNNNSYVYSTGLVVTNVGVGVQADLNSSMSMPNAKVSNATERGFSSTARSVITSIGAKATNCAIGFISDLGSLLFVSESSALNCTTSGYFAASMGQIEAYGTSAASTGNAVKYSPATSDSLGNSNGMIRFN